MLKPMEVDVLSRLIDWVLGAAGRVTAPPCPEEIRFYQLAVGRRAWGHFSLGLDAASAAAAIAPSSEPKLVAGAASANAPGHHPGLVQTSTHS